MPTRYVHTNLVARDWRRLAAFYRDVFDCVTVPPERTLEGKSLGRAVGLEGARLRGVHLRLPGHGDTGPTLEIFQYDSLSERPLPHADTPGYGHLAFAVDDVSEVAARVLSHGGSALGERAEIEVDGAGCVTCQYLRDPEGNILEIQSWSR